MNEVAIRTPHLIAAEIQSIKGQVRSVLLISSIEIGQRLIEAKAMLQHGEWGNWLQHSVDYSQSTANNLMQLYREYGSDAGKIPTLGNFSYTKAIALLGVPQEEREAFIEGNDVLNKSAREIQRLIKELNESRAEATSLATMRDVLLDEKTSLETSARITEQVLKDTQLTVKSLQEDLDREREQAKANVDRLTALVNESEADLDDSLVENLKKELWEAQDQLEKLTAKMNEPVTVEAAVVEKVPEETEQELAQLRQQVEQLKTQNSAAIHKYEVHFESLVSGFKSLLGALAEIGEADPAAYVKYRGAVTALIGKMSDRL